MEDSVSGREIVRQEFIEIFREMNLLKNFGVLNYTGTLSTHEIAIASLVTAPHLTSDNWSRFHQDY